MADCLEIEGKFEMGLKKWLQLRRAQKTADGICYQIRNGGAILLGFTKDASFREIPSQIDGMPVTEIQNLQGAPLSGTVIVPSTVRKIDDYGLSEISNMTALILPEGLEEIGYSAFSDNPMLEEVQFPMFFANVESTWGSFLDGCERLKRVRLPENLPVLSTSFFAGCEQLEEIQLPDSITEIGTDAFCDCLSLRKIQFPKSLRKIEPDAFCDCAALEEVRLPEGLKSLDECAFEECTNLRVVTLPNSLEYIGPGCFGGCENLIRPVIPSGCQVHPHAFDSDDLELEELG